jgi:hypothetical protein
MPAEQRREIHRRWARVVSEPEENARHVALAASGPDPDVAHVLDVAARAARTRGAPDAAAELAEHAARLTPPADDAGRRRRLAMAGGYRLVAATPGAHERS